MCCRASGMQESLGSPQILSHHPSPQTGQEPQESTYGYIKSFFTSREAAAPTALAIHLQKASCFWGEVGKLAFPGPPLYVWDLSCFAPHCLSSQQHPHIGSTAWPHSGDFQRWWGLKGH